MCQLIQSSEPYEVDSVLILHPSGNWVTMLVSFRARIQQTQTVLTSVLYWAEELKQEVWAGATCLGAFRIRRHWKPWNWKFQKAALETKVQVIGPRIRKGRVEKEREDLTKWLSHLCTWLFIILGKVFLLVQGQSCLTGIQVSWKVTTVAAVFSKTYYRVISSVTLPVS